MPYECKLCGNKLKLFIELDTYACMKCDRWCESRCRNKVCNLCNARPNKPSKFIQDSEKMNPRQRDLIIESWEPYSRDIREINGMICAIEKWMFTWSVSYGLCISGRAGRYCFNTLCDCLAFYKDWDGIEVPVVGVDGCTAVK